MMDAAGSPTDHARDAQLRASTSVADRPTGADGSTTALLAAEAVSFVIRRLPTRQSTRQLERIADHDPELLEAAASRCAHITAVEEDIRAGAVQLLERAASEIRIDRRQRRMVGTRPDRDLRRWDRLDQGD